MKVTSARTPLRHGGEPADATAVTSHHTLAATTGISPRASRAIRRSAIASAVVIAICATALSYSGLHALALRAGVDPRLAFVWPVIVDGLQLVGSLGVMYSTLSRISTKYPWFLMLLGTAISVVGNWVSAPPDLTSQVLHASAPLILALVLEELMRVARHKVSAAAAVDNGGPSTPGMPGRERRQQDQNEPRTQDRSGASQVTPSFRAVTTDSADASPGRAPDSTAPEHAPALSAGLSATPATVPDPAPVTVPEPRLGTLPTATPAGSVSPSPWPNRARAEQPVLSRTVPALATRSAPTASSDETAPTGTGATPGHATVPTVVGSGTVTETSRPSTGTSTGTGTENSESNPSGVTLRERVSRYVDRHPDAKAPDVYRALGTDPKYTRTILKEVLAARSDTGAA